MSDYDEVRSGGNYNDDYKDDDDDDDDMCVCVSCKDACVRVYVCRSSFFFI